MRRGVQQIRDIAGTKIILVSTISTLNGVESKEPLAELARDWQVGISFNSIEPTLDFGLTNSDHSPNLRFQFDPPTLHRFYAEALRLKRAGYPLMETEAILRDYVAGKPWKCEFERMFVYVSPDQQIYSCDYRHRYDLRHGSFEQYFGSREFREHTKSIESCNRCVRTCVRNYAYIYQLQPLHLFHLLRNAAALYRPTIPRPPGSVPPPIVPSSRRSRMGGSSRAVVTASVRRPRRLSRPASHVQVDPLREAGRAKGLVDLPWIPAMERSESHPPSRLGTGDACPPKRQRET